MKNHFAYFTSLSLIFIVACSTTDQLNNYKPGPESFSDAITSYEQSRSIKDLKFLASALEKENTASIDEIKKLKLIQNDSKWELVIEEVEAMLSREDKISNLELTEDQITSLDLFDIKSLNELTSPLAADACQYHYPLGVSLLLVAEKSNDRQLAKKAYKHLDIVYKYNARYENTDQLLSKAYDLASQNVLVVLDESVFESVPSEYLFAFEVLDVMDKDWVNFYGVNEQNVDFDLEVKLEISNFNISESNKIVSTSQASLGNGGDRDNFIYASTDFYTIDTVSIQMQAALNRIGYASTEYSSKKGGALNGKIIITDFHLDKILEEKNISFSESIDDSEFVSGPATVVEYFGIQNTVDRPISNLPLDKQFAMSLIQQTKSQMVSMIDSAL